MIIAIIFLAFGIFNFRWSFSSNVLNNGICISEAIDVKMTVVSENAKAIRKTLADNLENEFEFITHIVRTFPTNPTKRLAGIHMTLRTWKTIKIMYLLYISFCITEGNK
jgi:hypothetical protein